MTGNLTLNLPSDGRARFRQDIEWVAYDQGARWVARDPLSGTFFYFGPIEKEAAILMDGHRTPGDIAKELRKTFPSQSVSDQWLKGFLAKLGRACLLIPSEQAQNGVHPRKPSHWILQTILSPLSFRVPVWRPKQFTFGFQFLAKILFHPGLVGALLLAIPLCLFLFLNAVITNPDQSIYDLQRIQGDRWIWMILAYALVKSLHELGHVLACAKWGADCKEIGFLFLFFTPCLYCDTTNSWKLTSRWQRAAIAGAGIYVELWIACIACLIWRFTPNGLEHTIAASTMLMCSAGTILINGNPCFKYDGYYILSDLWRIPNLSQQSSSALWRWMVSCLGGRTPDPTEFDEDYRILASFAVVSTVYRLTVLFFLIWLVWFMLVPRGLGFLSIFVFATMSIGFCIQGYRFFVSFLAEFFSAQPIHLMRSIILLVSLVAAAYAAVMIPIPNSFQARCFLDYADKQPIYASQTAAIRFITAEGAELKRDQIILELDCPEKVLELQNLQDEISSVKTKYALLKKSAVNDATASYELPSLLELSKELESRRSLMKPELDALVQKAPGDGYFISAPTRIAIPLTPPKLEGLSTSPTHASHLGSTVERGTLLGWFTSKKKVVFQTLVPEADIKSLRIGMAARCLLDSEPARTVDCTVQKISPEPIEEIPKELLGDPVMVAVRTPKGAFQPETPHYMITLQSQRIVDGKAKGAIGTVHFQLQPKTLAERTMDYLRATIRHQE